MNTLIKDTTKEERILIARKALAISLTGAQEPSKKTLELIQQYIDGQKELIDIQQEIVKEYDENDK